MTLILCLAQFGQTLLYKACANGNDKIVQALLDHGVQVDIPDKVSDIHVFMLSYVTKQKLMKLL